MRDIPPNHLRSARRRASLSQEDVAALFGLASRPIISRHEMRRTTPPLIMALAYEIIYGKPVSALFPRDHARLRTRIRERARHRLAERGGQERGLDPERRKRSLERIAA